MEKLTPGLFDLAFSDTGIQTEILDALPFVITVQNRDRIVLYENKSSIDFLGSWKGKKCYLRWGYQEDFSNDVCEDCPGHVTFVDKISHKIVKQTIDPEGNAIVLEITHVPIIKEDPDFEVYIEIIRNITLQETQNIDLLQFPRDDISISFTRFGNSGGELIKTTGISFLEDLPDPLFFVKMSAFWFAAIGQGHSWPKGLFGPLPVLDYTNYLSYAFPMKLICEDAHDDRMGNYDLILCIIITNRFDKRLKTHFDHLETFMEQFFSSITDVKHLTGNLATSLQNELINIIPEYDYTS